MKKRRSIFGAPAVAPQCVLAAGLTLGIAALCPRAWAQESVEERVEEREELEPESVREPGPVAVEELREPVPWLGVSVREVDSLVREQLPGLRHGGLAVDFVMPKSPAEGAGVRQHDILYLVDEQILFTPRQLSLLIQSMQVGQETRLVLFRGGERQEVEVLLGSHLPAAAKSVRLPRYEGEVPPGLFSEFPQLEDLLRERPRGAMPGFRSSVIYLGDFALSAHDEDGTVEISIRDGKDVVRIRDPEGQSLFEGTLEEIAQGKGPGEPWPAKITSLTRRYRSSGLPWPSELAPADGGSGSD